MTFQRPAAPAPQWGLLDLIIGLGGMFGKPKINITPIMPPMSETVTVQNPNTMIFMPEDKSNEDWKNWIGNWGIKRNPTIPDLPAYPASGNPANISENLSDQIRRSWHDTHKDFAFTAVQDYFPDFTAPEPQPNQSYHQYIATMIRPALAEGTSLFEAPSILQNIHVNSLPELDTEWVQGDVADQFKLPPNPEVAIPLTKDGYQPTAEEEEKLNMYLDKLAQHEGGYNNVKSDRGGPTKYGINTVQYRGIRQEPAFSGENWPDNVRDLTQEQANQIYRERYYYNFNLQKIDSDPIRELITDMVVNNGYNKSAEILKDSLDKVIGTKNYGEGKPAIGPAMRASIEDVIKQDKINDLMNTMLDMRDAHYKNLAKKEGQAGFEKGWLARNKTFRNNPDPNPWIKGKF